MWRSKPPGLCLNRPASEEICWLSGKSSDEVSGMNGAGTKFRYNAIFAAVRAVASVRSPGRGMLIAAAGLRTR